jgi:peptide/nickel transport system substrate-binding protein
MQSIKDKIGLAVHSFSKMEFFAFSTLVIVFIVSTLAMLNNINQSFMVEVPRHGGSISEGILGSPRFINPVLAFSSADQDLVSLIYSGLLRKNFDGTFIPDLAEKYEISKDGLIYTFSIKNNAYFHDGKPVTAEDIIFTINMTRDSIIKNSNQDWEGVQVEKIDRRNIKFLLKKPRASFLESLTLGILPKYIWENSPIELNGANTNPIGSGPYSVSKVNKQESGIIESYELKAFKKFTLGKPYIENINLYFYANEDDLISALKNKKIDQISSITPQNLKLLDKNLYQIESSVLPRIFGLFFNQNQAQIFTNKDIVRIIDQAIDKNKILQEVLMGYGTIIDNPIPNNIIKLEKSKYVPPDVDNIYKFFTKNVWTRNTNGFWEKITKKATKKTPENKVMLEFSIATGNSPELINTANLIKDDLATIGIKVEIKNFEISNLNQSVIRPRRYDSLLFGQVINSESDLLAFWHSSQRKDPGLNIAMYTNGKSDKILEDAITTVDESSKIKKYNDFLSEIKKDMPAIFLYSPNFIYVLSKNLQGFNLGQVISPANRFSNVYSWYTKTDNIWRIFAN